ncbi:MAG: RluA family pseudouridine synthase [Gammaproteobacteria bacterium]|nr:RluA family pseudouridine synthase [Gammaproteobacteria bacterium]
MPVRYITVNDHVGQRLDNFLIRELRPVPKRRIMQMIRRGEVRVNSKRARVGLRLEEGDRIRVPPIVREEPPDKDIGDSLKAHVRERVIFEDDRLIIVNKPVGLAVHAGGTIQVGLIDVVRSIYESDRIELAHRIDKDTSGCVVMTRTRVALLEVHHAFNQKLVEKHYDAIVFGQWPENCARIDLAIRRFSMPNGERRAEIDSSGREALTEFSIKSRCPSATWLDAVPITGRTHQIRVHAASTGHFVLGDPKYSRANSSIKVPRMLLHASSITFAKGPRVQAPLDQSFTECWHRLCQED